MRRRAMAVTGHRPKIAEFLTLPRADHGRTHSVIGLVLHAGTAAAQSSSKVAALYLPAGRAFDWSYAGYKGACGLLPAWAGSSFGCMNETSRHSLMQINGGCCQRVMPGQQLPSAAAPPPPVTACCRRLAAPADGDAPVGPSFLSKPNYDVKSFGAKGDGKADDTAALKVGSLSAERACECAPGSAAHGRAGCCLSPPICR